MSIISWRNFRGLIISWRNFRGAIPMPGPGGWPLLPGGGWGSNYPGAEQSHDQRLGTGRGVREMVMRYNYLYSNGWTANYLIYNGYVMVLHHRTIGD